MFQSLFDILKGKSTLQQLVVFLDFIYSNSSDQFDVIYLDIKKAFNSIPHNKLLSKLYSHGIQGKLWKWFKSYLTGRTQHLRINQSLSTPCRFFLEFPKGVFWDLYCS